MNITTLRRTAKMKLLSRKRRANISIMVAVFCMAFLVFCAFGVDMAYVTLNRAKLQRAAETTALASIAEYKNSAQDKSEDFFKLFKSKIDVLKNAQIESVEYKDGEDNSKKVKISAKLVSPTFFLRFAGVGKINIKANSYAQAYEEIIKNKTSGDTIELENQLTDKNGNDIKIETANLPEGYFIFAGIKNNDGVIMWSDIGCKADSTSTIEQVWSSQYNLINVNNTYFDLSKTCEPNIDTNIVSYLRLYRAKFTEEHDYSFTIRILNNVKLITKNDF